jgi:hypothetical protein
MGLILLVSPLHLAVVEKVVVVVVVVGMLVPDVSFPAIS